MSAREYESNVTKPLHYRSTTRLHKSVKMAAVLLLLRLLTAEVQAQSALDGFDPNANDLVRALVVQPDGKILIGGEFTTVFGVARNFIARLNPDGTLDTGFTPNANDEVYGNRGAGRRQDFGGRWFHEHRRTAAQRDRPARCHHRSS
jgi:hypothetical protein